MCRTLISHKFTQNTDHHGNFICIYLGARVKIVFYPGTHLYTWNTLIFKCCIDLPTLLNIHDMHS